MQLKVTPRHLPLATSFSQFSSTYFGGAAEALARQYQLQVQLSSNAAQFLIPLHASSQMLAGIVGPATNWKIPFVVMAAPTLILAFVLFITTKEPPRGAFEEALTGQLAAGEAYSETMSLAKFKRMLKIPSNWFIVIQVGVVGLVAFGLLLIQ